jgi:xanthine dehydrogenase YagS FAD-binding subunit
MTPFAWQRARTITDAAAAVSTTVAAAMTAPADATAVVVKAGGIDLLGLMKDGLLAPEKIVSLIAVPGFDGISEAADGGLRIGAMATLATIAERPLLRRRYPALADAAGSAASPQLRAVATIGGNLLQRPQCWYFRAAEYRCLRKGGGHCFALGGENQYHAIFGNHLCAIVHASTPATALVALGATVELVAADGGVRQVGLEDFFVGPATDVQCENDLRPHEILTAVLLPPAPGKRMAHVKQGEKDSMDWPLADVAAVLELAADGTCAAAAIVLGAAAPVPHRARAAEAALVGRRVDEAAATDAARAALAGATPLSRNAYKLPLFETLVRRAILAAAQS